MSDLEVFGPLIDAAQVDEAVQLTIEKWASEYLRWAERHKGKPANWMANPRSYTISSDFDHFPEEQLPAVLIMCEAAGDPKMDGQKQYRAHFPVRVGVFVEANTRQNVDILAKLYGAAFRALILQKGSLGGFATGAVWRGERFAPRIPERAKRTMASVEIEFEVEVRNVVRRLAGPIEPRTEPVPEAPAWPQVTKKTVPVEKPEAIH